MFRLLASAAASEIIYGFWAGHCSARISTVMRNSFSFLFAGLFFLFAAARTQADKLVLVAGGGTDEADGVPARKARLKEPFGMGFDAAGNLFIIEMAKGNRLLKMDARGVLTRV